ncbi:dipeptidase E [Pasteurella testudinis DSM 23072]|uniref:dipeptidase E n=1 Tax=Pasteurella testudinis DSM 23072 TaxID=1122938 RepID=A0A1W1ULP7_9PAST|nr:dipeptidase PepE [Pasteurella testudinis]SMB82007.1 dipeptidase E [Pasteurella testudinis DSM 23072]SUB52388.1 peptidase E [Pasteurella testudinis]
MSVKKMLLMSGSKYRNTGYLEHCTPWISRFLADYQGKTLAFVPYAGVSRSYDQYEQAVKQAFESLEMRIISVHQSQDPSEIIEQADAIAIGGGNTFCLLNQLYQHNLLEPIRAKVQGGTPYFGWSAGANVVGASIMTTNDMPIVYPPSFEALNLFPAQINPHFISGKMQGHNGESREERLNEFLLVNPKAVVYAMPEGTALLVRGECATVIGYDSILRISGQMDVEEMALNSTFNYAWGGSK